MNRKQIITSVGVAFLTVGVVGGTWSGIQAMPKVINNFQISQAKQDEAEILYNSEEKITKLNIDSKLSSISIRKHDKPNVIVERRGNKEISTVTAEGGNNELTIKEESRNITKETKNVDDIVRYFIDEMYSSHHSEIIVYLPEKVNADIKTDYSGFVVVDDILLDTLNYETHSGHISLSPDLSLKDLNIKSSSNISLGIDEMSGIKNVKVIANSVNIHEGSYIENEDNIPENLEIKTTSGYEGEWNVNISSNTPVAKNLVIDSTSIVGIDLPVVDYKFNFDIKASRGIRFEASDYDKYKNTPVEKYFKNSEYEEEIGYDEEVEYKEEQDLIKELKGLINEEVKENASEYSVKIKSEYTVFN